MADFGDDRIWEILQSLCVAFAKIFEAHEVLSFPVHFFGPLSITNFSMTSHKRASEWFICFGF